MSSTLVMTDHAILRWLERVEKIDLKPIVAAYVEDYGHRPEDWELVDYIEDETGLAREDVEAKAVSPGMRSAVRCGASRFRLGKRHVMIVRDERIVTIIPTAPMPRIGQVHDQRRGRRRENRRGRIYEMEEMHG